MSDPWKHCFHVSDWGWRRSYTTAMCVLIYTKRIWMWPLFLHIILERKNIDPPTLCILWFLCITIILTLGLRQVLCFTLNLYLYNYFNYKYSFSSWIIYSISFPWRGCHVFRGCGSLPRSVSSQLDIIFSFLPWYVSNDYDSFPGHATKDFPITKLKLGWLMDIWTAGRLSLVTRWW